MPSSRNRASKLHVLVMMLVAAAASVAAPSAAGAQDDGIASLDWLAGAWLRETPGNRLEEWWTPAAGNSMVGTFRWMRNGELWMSELMYIVEGADGLTFRLRHFSAAMQPWEGADDPFVYRLGERSARRIAFRSVEPRADRPTRFVFEALPGDSLLVRLEGEENGDPAAQDFRFGRLAPPPR